MCQDKFFTRPCDGKFASDTNDIPATAAIKDANAKDPSPNIEPNPISQASLKCLTCLDVVPEAIKP